MQTVIVRILMWVFIVASVWIAARYYGQSPEQEAMMDAARHYQAYKSQVEQKDDATPAPAAEKKP